MKILLDHCTPATLLETIQPRETHYLFTAEMLEIEKRRGRQFKR